MTSLDAGLLTAVAMLSLLVAGLLRAQSTSSKRLLQLERRLNRSTRATARVPESTVDPVLSPTGPLPGDADDRDAEGEGDAVDIEGLAPDGTSLIIELESVDEPVLLAFLSTTCGICVSLWEQLRDGGLADLAPGVRAVVVTKDAPPEDPDRVGAMVDQEQRVPVVLSSEAWIDYEVPGSPYLMLVAGRPASVVDEGSVTGWDGLAAMVGKVRSPQP